MPTPERKCATCEFLDGRYCRRNAPVSHEGDWQLAVLAWLFKLYFRDDDEIAGEPLKDVMMKYVDVNFQTYAHWPYIEWPDEEWCGEWRPKEKP